MKTNKIFAAIVFGFVACATSVNAQENVNLNDFAYQMAKFEKSHYTDHVVYSYADDPHEYTAGSLAKHGAYIGGGLGVQNFDGHTSPEGGVVLGWEGGKRVPVKSEYNGTLTVGFYTKEADRDNKYAAFDSRMIGAVCLGTSSNKQWRFWLGAYFSYKLSFDYHENNSTTTTVRETDSEIVTTIDQIGNNYEFKASSMGVGGYAEVGYTPYMSHWSYRLYAGFGTQQRFYDDGNRFHPEAFGGLKIVYNFSVASMWDKVFLQKTGLSKKQAKKLSKQRAKMAVSNY